MQLCIFEDPGFKNFLPLVYFRPVYSLLCGATNLRSKVERLFPKASVIYHCRPNIAEYLRARQPGGKVNELSEGATWFVNGRVLADKTLGRVVQTTPRWDKVFLSGGSVVAAYVSAEFIRTKGRSLLADLISPDSFRDLSAEDVDVQLLRFPWELIHRNGEALGSDFSSGGLGGRKAGVRIYPGSHLLNKRNILIGKGTVVKPGAVLDAEQGPIIIGENATIHPNAVIQGPVFVGASSIVKAGAKIYGGTSVGDACKVGGEIEASIIHSYSNKQHDGFLGHSYLGSWVNIGADTNTSNLKNNYGIVDVVLSGERIDTGMQFVGLFMGDHSKTGINVMFDTGTIVGVSCNIYGANLPPKEIPSFSWGSTSSPFSAYRLEKSIETAQRVMARRNVKWTDAYEKLFRFVFDATTPDRARHRVF